MDSAGEADVADAAMTPHLFEKLRALDELPLMAHKTEEEFALQWAQGNNQVAEPENSITAEKIRTNLPAAHKTSKNTPFKRNWYRS
ncbi:MAG: hypothetical protein ACKOYK_05865 [Cyanobium sp.]